MTHDQFKKLNENSPLLFRVSSKSPKNAELQILKNIIGMNDRITKLKKKNQTAFGSSCFMVYEFDDFNRKAGRYSFFKTPSKQLG